MQLLVVVRVEVAMKQVGLKIVNVIGRINNTKITTMSMEEGSSITSTAIKVTSLCKRGAKHRNQYEMPQSAGAASSYTATPNYPTNTTYHGSPNKQLAQQLQQQKLSPLELQLQREKQAEQQKAYEAFQ